MSDTEQSISGAEQSENQQKVNLNRGARIIRKAATTLTAAALVVAYSGKSSEPVTTDITKSPPGTEQVQNPFPSVETTVNKLKDDPSVEKDMQFLPLGDLRMQYQEADFEASINNGYYSAPVVEITYDKATQSLLFEDKTPKGLSKQNQYNFLSPLVTNFPLIAAFKAGKLDRASIRLNKTNTDPTLAGIDGHNGVFNPADQSDFATKGKLKSVFIYLPGSNTFSSVTYNSLFSHEPLHALTVDVSLSEKDKDLAPAPDELSKWQGVCRDIRNIAVDQAEKQTQDLLQIMEENRGLFKEKGLAAFDQVYNALKSGDFNSFEPKAGDKVTDFSAKVPECKVLGPWRAFLHYIVKEGIVTNTNISTEAIMNMGNELNKVWAKVVQNNTIYSLLREGPYNERAGASDRDTGHPYDNWDELIVSVTNVLLIYPEAFADLVKQLPPDQITVAMQLIDLSVKTVDAQVPPDDLEFHQKLQTSYENFKNA